MVRVRKSYTTVTCDVCNVEKRDNDGQWYSLQANFDVQQYGAYSNGSLNSQIDRRHYDFCSVKHAEQKRADLLQVVIVRPQPNYSEEVVDAVQ